jgi:energy-coupling factor transporter ATP-binding protein EcfA2
MFLEISQLSVHYPGGRGAAVDAVSLGLGAGEIGVLIGPSGCGKTSLLRCVAGLEPLAGGRVAMGGTVLADASCGVHVAPDVRAVSSEYVLAAQSVHGAAPVPAKILFTTPDSEFGNPDFAVLELQSGRPLEPLSLGSDPKPLDNVVAAGFPGLTISSDVDTVSPDVVFSQGEVSVVQPRSSEVSLVIHTANFAPGSSGGPLINRCGTVVGVNTFLQAGTEFEGRALYSLSSVALVSFLSSVGVPFQYVPSECVSGGG